MYFLSRNNKLFDYIVHTQRQHRYWGTFLALLVIVSSSYIVHYYCDVYIMMLEQEIQQLCDKNRQYKKIFAHNNELTHVIAHTKNDIQAYVLAEKRDKLFQELFSFILEQARSVGVVVNSFTVQKMYDKNWYVKEKLHFVVTGTREKIVDFIKNSGRSGKMIAFSDWSLQQSENVQYTFSADISFLCVI